MNSIYPNKLTNIFKQKLLSLVQIAVKGSLLKKILTIVGFSLSSKKLVITDKKLEPRKWPTNVGYKSIWDKFT